MTPRLGASRFGSVRGENSFATQHTNAKAGAYRDCRQIASLGRNDRDKQVTQLHGITTPLGRAPRVSVARWTSARGGFRGGSNDHRRDGWDQHLRRHRRGGAGHRNLHTAYWPESRRERPQPDRRRLMDPHDQRPVRVQPRGWHRSVVWCRVRDVVAWRRRHGIGGQRVRDHDRCLYRGLFDRLLGAPGSPNAWRPSYRID